MDHQDDYEYDDESEFEKSKSQVKKEMYALKALGESLIDFTPAQLDKLPISEKLRTALEDAPRIRQNSAKKRHLQYIGKLMRSEDADVIEEAVNEVKEASHRATRQLHLIEQWRDELLSGQNEVVAKFIEENPQCDRQLLRQLIRTAKKESDQKKPPASARKLFKLIRETLGS